MTSSGRQVVLPFSTATDRKVFSLSSCMIWSVRTFSQLVSAATSTDGCKSKTVNASILFGSLFAAWKRARMYSLTRSLSQSRSPMSARDIGFLKGASWFVPCRWWIRKSPFTLLSGRTPKYPPLVFASVRADQPQNFAGTKWIFNPGQSTYLSTGETGIGIRMCSWTNLRLSVGSDWVGNATNL